MEVSSPATANTAAVSVNPAEQAETQLMASNKANAFQPVTDSKVEATATESGHHGSEQTARAESLHSTRQGAWEEHCDSTSAAATCQPASEAEAPLSLSKANEGAQGQSAQKEPTLAAEPAEPTLAAEPAGPSEPKEAAKPFDEMELIEQVAVPELVQLAEQASIVWGRIKGYPAWPVSTSLQLQCTH